MSKTLFVVSTGIYLKIVIKGICTFLMYLKKLTLFYNEKSSILILIMCVLI